MKLSVVCWKWGTMYSPDYINNLYNMLQRHLHLEHQLYCVTDDPTGIDDRVTCLPMFPDTFPGMASPSGHRANFRRLKTFDKSLESVFGPRILMLDIDIVIVDDVTALFSRPEPLVAWDQWHGNDGKRKKYNTSVVLMDTGVLDHMWQEFRDNPTAVWDVVKKSRVGDANNSDQAVFCYYAINRHTDMVSWSRDDGIQPFYRVQNNDGAGIPEGTRAVLFFGNDKPADPEVQKKCPWIAEHWR